MEIESKKLNEIIIILSVIFRILVRENELNSRTFGRLQRISASSRKYLSEKREKNSIAKQNIFLASRIERRVCKLKTVFGISLSN